MQYSRSRTSLRKTIVAAGIAMLSFASSAAPFAYVPYTNDPKASTPSVYLGVFDVGTLEQKASVPIRTSPFGVAANRQGTYVYVTDLNSNALQVIDTSKNVVIANITVPYRPKAVAVNPGGDRVYVSTNKTLTVIDAKTNAVIKDIQLPKFDDQVGLDISPDGKQVFASSGNGVAVIDAFTNEIVSVLNVPEGTRAGLIALNSNGSRIFVANLEPKDNFGKKMISLIDVRTNTAFAPMYLLAAKTLDRMLFDRTRDVGLWISDFNGYFVETHGVGQVCERGNVKPSIGSYDVWLCNGDTTEQSAAPYRALAPIRDEIMNLDIDSNGKDVVVVSKDYLRRLGRLPTTIDSFAVPAGYTFLNAPGHYIGPAPGDVSSPMKLPPVSGIGEQPNVFRLNSDQETCILTTIRNQLGDPAARYLGQGPDGVAKIGLSGGALIVFYPVSKFNTADREQGILWGKTNVLTLGTSCGSVGVIPAFQNVADFGKMMKAQGITVDITSTGIMVSTAIGGAVNYVARPNFIATPTNVPGSVKFKEREDKLFQLTDSNGYEQLVFPAFAQPDAVERVILGPWGTPGSWSIRPDGTGWLFANDGREFQFVPNYTLAPAPEGLGTVWQEGDGTVYVRNSAKENAQGFKINRWR